MPKVAKNTKHVKGSRVAEARQSARLIKDTTVDFAPVLGRRRKPWNPEWFVYEFMCNRFISKAQRVVDFGCGQGISSLRLARIGYDVYGIDDNAGDLHIARGLARRYHLSDNCRFRTMKMSTLRVEDESIDLVVGFDFFSMKDIAAVIGEAHRILKPGGVAILKGQASESLFDPSGAIGFFAGEQSESDNAAGELTGQGYMIIEQLFDRVDQENFTILNRLDRFTQTCDQNVLNRLQRLDHRMHVACPALADLGNTVVLTCWK